MSYEAALLTFLDALWAAIERGDFSALSESGVSTDEALAGLESFGEAVRASVPVE